MAKLFTNKNGFLVGLMAGVAFGSYVLSQYKPPAKTMREVVTPELLTKVRFLESSGRVKAVSEAGSKGPDQFQEQTFLEQLYLRGKGIGYGHLSMHIQKSVVRKNGKIIDPEYYVVPDAKKRKEIMAAIQDPKLMGLLTNEYMVKNLTTIDNKFPELKYNFNMEVIGYKTHHFGEGGALKIAAALQNNPKQAFVDVVGYKACSKNFNICYYKDGAPRSVGNVYSLLKEKLDTAPTEYAIR